MLNVSRPTGRWDPPEGALRWLAYGALIGAVYVLVEAIPKVHRFLPESTGVDLGLVLAVSYDLSFFAGGFVMWIVLGRWLKWSDVTPKSQWLNRRQLMAGGAGTLQIVSTASVSSGAGN